MKNNIDAHENILALIGNTPLIKLNKSVSDYKGKFFAKYEAISLAPIMLKQVKKDLDRVI